MASGRGGHKNSLHQKRSSEKTMERIAEDRVYADEEKSDEERQAQGAGSVA
ncbi:Uu.00g143090.m01.CDS01 [Anthostomella pinea]|uniref:Uu.00g143090.m01.CDS01 n=1 Tax=Anthostomella pinea TaxID=933095 RepID=A0AAI8VRH8_9PEZI|nr:Uu.00g143090.m01.CDS01 [Anthostomella pinea]